MHRKILAISIFVLSFAISLNAFAKEIKIGYVNMRKVFFEYEKTKEFNAKLETEDEETKKAMNEKTQELRKLRDELDLLSDEAKKKKEPELKQKLKELDAIRKEKLEGFIRKRDAMFKEIRDDIVETTADYAKKNNYDIILDDAVLLYSSKSYEITENILKVLNKK